MTYLFDTHARFWHLFDPAKLSPAARQAIEDGEAGKDGLVVLSLVLAELYYILLKFQVDDLFPEILDALLAIHIIKLRQFSWLISEAWLLTRKSRRCTTD